MHNKIVSATMALAISILGVAAAWGQSSVSQSVSQVFHFTYTQAPIDVQQLTNTIRTIAEITQSSLSDDYKTLAVSGTPAQISMAEWIFTAMDQPAPSNAATQEYRPAGTANDVVRLLYLAHTRNPTTFQEIVNAVRTVPEITKAFPDTGQHALVIRGTDAKVNMGEWIFHQMDLPAGLQPVQGQTAAIHEYSVSAPHDLVRTMSVVHPLSPQSFMEMVNAIRTIPELPKVFPSMAAETVTFRGTPETVALATWIFNQLDRPIDSQPQAVSASPKQFQMPNGADDVTRVFYLPPQTSDETSHGIVNSLRSTVKVTRVFPVASQKAVLVRGAATQIAAADLLIHQMN